MTAYSEFFKDKHIFNKFLYGSRVYGTHTHDSDFDYIIVCDQEEDKIDSIMLDGVDYTVYSMNGFIKEINNHEISVLECLFLSPLKFTGSVEFDFKLDLQKLRHAISQKSSNSFVKAKKKLIENDILIAQKSMFHSLRIVMFGIQIAKYGKIVDYSEANHYLTQIKSLPLEWENWKMMFQPIHNSLLSEFRKLAPKL